MFKVLKLCLESQAMEQIFAEAFNKEMVSTLETFYNQTIP
jgi:hypothetical protein